MLLLDVNIVLAAHRDDHPHHTAVRAWFDHLVTGTDPFAVPIGVWASFLRLATNRRIFTVPTPLPEAFTFLDAVRAQPNHVQLAPGRRHLEILREVCEQTDATGDLIPDAVLAALAVEHDAEVITLDRDFARFPMARHRHPTAATDTPRRPSPAPPAGPGRRRL
jgi:hypothetical protein